MKKLSIQYWEPVLNAFNNWYPELADLTIDWYPIRQMEILIKLSDGRKFIFDFMEQNIHEINTEEEFYFKDEMEFRKLFSERLIHKMKVSGMTQFGLSVATGISLATINKYVNWKATPSLYNLLRICHVLKCTPNELSYFIK